MRYYATHWFGQWWPIFLLIIIHINIGIPTVNILTELCIVSVKINKNTTTRSKENAVRKIGCNSSNPFLYPWILHILASADTNIFNLFNKSIIPKLLQGGPNYWLSWNCGRRIFYKPDAFPIAQMAESTSHAVDTHTCHFNSLSRWTWVSQLPRW